MIKDLENIEGDLSNSYQTIPVNYGENFSKKIISLLLLCTVVPVYFLINVYDVGHMDIYFYISYILLLIFVLKLWNSEGKVDYIKLHFLLKIILLAGVICIVLIKPTVIENGQKLLLIK